MLGMSNDQDLFKSCLDLTSHSKRDDSHDDGSSALELDNEEDFKSAFPSIE